MPLDVRQQRVSHWAYQESVVSFQLYVDSRDRPHIARLAFKCHCALVYLPSSCLMDSKGAICCLVVDNTQAKSCGQQGLRILAQDSTKGMHLGL